MKEAVRAERVLVAKARATLDRDPALALKRLRELGQAYPRGSLREERDRLTIVALMRLTRAAEAQTAARRFLDHYPNSIHRALAESVLER